MDSCSKNITVIEKRIKYLRELKELTQEELGEKIGISRSVINSWENGYANISLKFLVKISFFYKVPVDYILGLINNEFDRNNYDFQEVLDLTKLGRRIRIIRKTEDLTQSEFAKKIKTKNSCISRYESGKIAMSSADLKDICDTFGYSADWCLGNLKQCVRRDKKVKLEESEILQYLEI